MSHSLPIRETTAGTLLGEVVRLFVRERILELRIERARDQKVTDGTRPTGRIQGETTTFVYLASCPEVLDGKKVQKNAEPDKNWFASDEGWNLLKVGAHVSIEHEGFREISAPKALQDDGRTGNTLRAYSAHKLQLVHEAVAKA